MTNQITKINQEATYDYRREIRPFIPTDIPSMMEFAKIMIKSGLIPSHVKTPEEVVILGQAGAAVGMTMMQSVQGFMAIKGSPAPFGDTPLGIVRASGKLLYIKEEFIGNDDALVARCTVHRVGEKEPVTQEFSVHDAKTAKLWGKPGTWTTHPKRMLKYKARGFILRDVFPDVLLGLSHSVEELEGEMINVTPILYDNPTVESIAPVVSTILLYGTDAYPAQELPVTEIYSHIRRECEKIESVEQFNEYYAWWKAIYVQIKHVLTKEETKELGEIFFPKKKQYGENTVAEAA